LVSAGLLSLRDVTLLAGTGSAWPAGAGAKLAVAVAHAAGATTLDSVSFPLLSAFGPCSPGAAALADVIKAVDEAGLGAAGDVPALRALHTWRAGPGKNTGSPAAVEAYAAVPVALRAEPRVAAAVVAEALADAASLGMGGDAGAGAEDADAIGERAGLLRAARDAVPVAARAQFAARVLAVTARVVRTEAMFDAAWVDGLLRVYVDAVRATGVVDVADVEAWSAGTVVAEPGPLSEAGALAAQWAHGWAAGVLRA
jgi:hypothetical protein